MEPGKVNPAREVATTLNDLKAGERTLVCLLQGMHGVRTTVELRSDAEVEGTILSVESDMSISMVDVTIKSDLRPPIQCEDFYVVGNFIRYVHIPTTIHVEKTIKKRIHDTQTSSRKERRPRSKMSTPTARATSK
eukprot:m.95229 g.95229  ORF g.95229 m.95229 type:complete len:135 (-) comp12322_c0_seq4:2019-2423(-)